MSETVVGTAVQLVPPSVEYCHVPLPLERPVTAMPATELESTSAIEDATTVETSSPGFVVSSVTWNHGLGRRIDPTRGLAI